MRRSEQREHIFKLLFMTQFNTENEMPEQLSIYFEGLGEVSEKDQEAIQQKYDHILEHLEMKMDEDVPVGVAINEAVELAKLFGGEDSGSFVNGILGKIASGKKDSGEEPKRPRRQTHSAKIIIRSSKKEHRKASEESAE